MFLPTMAPFGFIALSWLPTDTLLAVVPTLGQQMIVIQVLGGESPAAIMFLLAGASSMLLGLFCVMLTARLFQHERIVFGSTS